MTNAELLESLERLKMHALNLKFENKKLREALEKVANGDNCMHGFECAYCDQQAAKAALEPSKEKPK